MRIATLNLHRYFLTLLVILPWYSPLSAQATGEDGQLYLDFAGSAVFPYDPRAQSDSGGVVARFKVGTGFTAAFGYAFKEGFSTEMEWGYQKVGIGNPPENFSQSIDVGGFTSTFTVENELGTIELPIIGLPTEPLRTTVAYEDSRFAYQIMGGLSARASKRVEFHLGYRFRSSRGAEIDADHIEAGIRFRF